MVAVSHRLAAYEKTIASVFDAVLDDRLAPTALQAVAEYVGTSTASYLLVNKLTQQVSAVARWGSFIGNSAEYLAHYSKIDPFRVIQAEAQRGAISQLSDRLPQSVLQHDEWYNDYLLKGGTVDALGIKLNESRSRMVLLGLHRAVDAPVDARPQQRGSPAYRVDRCRVSFSNCARQDRPSRGGGDLRRQKRSDCRDKPRGRAGSAPRRWIDDA
jgi:hypothetical protein